MIWMYQYVCRMMNDITCHIGNNLKNINHVVYYKLKHLVKQNVDIQNSLPWKSTKGNLTAHMVTIILLNEDI